jgi:hypothetical protein
MGGCGNPKSTSKHFHVVWRIQIGLQQANIALDNENIKLLEFLL